MSASPIAFRADASLEMGSGHVMRCLTLADVLAARGHVCHFICRAHEGHLGAVVSERGHKVHMLSNGEMSAQPPANGIVGAGPYARWLAISPEQDARETAAVLAEIGAEWLVVDHYALGAAWEGDMAPYVANRMVIDDLANRPHDCHILLDQTLGRGAVDYAGLVPAGARLLCGSAYALLRPAFAALRAESLSRRRQNGVVRKILVSMGGVDADNLTGQVLNVLHQAALSKDYRMTVIMGRQAPWLEDVQDRAARLPLPTEVLVGVEDMARLMADSDLAIGAAGASAWERCCLGLPTIMFIAADNQRGVAAALATAGAATVLAADGLWSLPRHVTQLVRQGTSLAAMSERAAKVTDGHGARLVADAMVGAHAR